MLQSDPVALPLTAPTTLEQFRENIAALGLRLTADQVKRLNEAGYP